MADQVLFARQNGVPVLKFTGDIRFTVCPAVDGFLKRLFVEKTEYPVVVDLTETTSVDSTALGVIAKVANHYHREMKMKPALLASPGDVLKVIKSMSFDRVFTVMCEAGVHGSFEELQPVQPEEQDMVKLIISAHKTLMNLSRENKAKFENVISVLEQQAEEKKQDAGT